MSDDNTVAAEETTPAAATEKPKKMKFPNMAKDKLAQLAKDIAMDKVFTTAHLGDPTLIGSVFMPLALGALKDTPKEMIEDIGFVYEYLDKAGPRCINGYPMFLSCAMVSKADARRIWAKVDRIKKVLSDL